MSNRIFTFCLISSLVIHIVLILGLSWHIHLLSVHQKQAVEVTYNVSRNKSKAIIEKQLEMAKKNFKPDPKKDLDILSKDSSKLAFDKTSFKSIEKTPTDFKLDHDFSHVTRHMTKEKVSIPLLDSQEISNPKYQNYNQVIRQRIKEHAYYYVDHPDFRSGEVYLTFVINGRGELAAVRVIESRTRANDYLKTIAMQSVKDSAPFPAFPTDLKYPELTFNVVISFEVDGQK
ncbi:MAG: hypothetical protein HQL26_04600 [Candidatus Omnitrophica bacterium]|nr:hypothetical protein [Candidatus Omnitrophota bacterium]